jgi:phosphoglycolate phosphatase
VYQYILFDLDGTLTDPREGITKSVQYALRHMGIEEPDLSALEHFIGPPLHDELMRCYGFDRERAEQAIAAYRVRFRQVGWQENVLFEGVPQMLAKLKNSGKKLAIASSKPAVFVEKILRHFEIAAYFDAVSGATLDGAVSTKAQVVEQALQMLGAPERKQTVLVGDRVYDVEGACQNGIDCIGLTMGFGGREELETAGAVQIVDTWDALLQVLLAS